jgi:hypothetical protein
MATRLVVDGESSADTAEQLPTIPIVDQNDIRRTLPDWKGGTAPTFVTEEILKYIDAVREEGSVNMFGCGPLVQDRFPELSGAECRKCVDYWMQTFEERHPE